MGIQSPTDGGKVQCNEIHANQGNEIQLDFSSLKAHRTGHADNSCSVSGFTNTSNNSKPLILNQWKSVNQAQTLQFSVIFVGTKVEEQRGII
ncbi:hypothetical protein C1H46_018667 [Malus baccata]|uniref:Uncharacterized protein n=1 Tax=Malus baccata TaxID=106549 RepID=A0A540MAF0_MALBA|nr:hypothetical protein C1H46_018667 [Malus baccata]